MKKDIGNCLRKMPKRAWFNFRTFNKVDKRRENQVNKWTTKFVETAKKEYIESISWQ